MQGTHFLTNSYYVLISLREIVPALRSLNMNMVRIIRHEVGKSTLVKALPLAAIAAAACGFIPVLLKQPEWMAYVGMVVGFLVGEASAYLGGWSNETLVRQYVKMVAAEQEKVLPMAAAYKTELQEQLRLIERDPLLVYERLRKKEIRDVKNRHEQSAGERTLDIELSRKVRKAAYDLELLQFAKKEGMALSPQEVDSLRQHTLKGIAYNDQVTADATKTLAEARAYLAKAP